MLHPKGPGYVYCPRGMQVKGPETTPMAGSGVEWTLQDKKEKSPEDRASLPFPGRDEPDGPHQDRMPTQFVSHFYFQLGVVQMDDVTGKCCLPEIKAGGKKMARRALQETGGKTTPQAKYGLHQQQEESPRADPSEGFRSD